MWKETDSTDFKQTYWCQQITDIVTNRFINIEVNRNTDFSKYIHLSKYIDIYIFLQEWKTTQHILFMATWSGVMYIINDHTGNMNKKTATAYISNGQLFFIWNK